MLVSRQKRPMKLARTVLVHCATLLVALAVRVAAQAPTPAPATNQPPPFAALPLEIQQAYEGLFNSLSKGDYKGTLRYLHPAYPDRALEYHEWPMTITAELFERHGPRFPYPRHAILGVNVRTNSPSSLYVVIRGGIQGGSGDTWEKTDAGWRLRSGCRAITHFFDALTYPKEGVPRAAILLPRKPLMLEAEFSLPPDVVLEEVISREISYLAFSADSKRLFVRNHVNSTASVSSTADGVWQTNFWAGKQQDWSGGAAMAASPDGRHLAVSNSDRVLVWDIASAQLHARVPVNWYPGARRFRFSSDGRWLSADGEWAGYGAIDFVSGKMLFSETNRGMGLMLSKDAKHLAVARIEAGKEELALVDLTTGKRILTAAPPPALVTNSASGTFSISGLGEVEFPLTEAGWLKSPRPPLMGELRDPTEKRPPGALGTWYDKPLFVTPDHRFVLMQCVLGNIAVFDTKTKALVSLLRGFPKPGHAGGAIMAILISPDSRLVACASRHGEVAIWKLPAVEP